MAEKIINRKVGSFGKDAMTKGNNDFVETTTERAVNSLNGINYEFGYPIEIRYQLETTYSTTVINIMEDDNTGFILVPLLVLVGIIVLSALVYLMARNRRRIAHIYCKRNNAPAYNIEGLDANLGENGAIESEDYDDIDDPTECLLKGKLQIDRNRYLSCQTTNVTGIGSSKDMYA